MPGTHPMPAPPTSEAACCEGHVRGPFLGLAATWPSAHSEKLPCMGGAPPSHSDCCAKQKDTVSWVMSSQAKSGCTGRAAYVGERRLAAFKILGSQVQQHGGDPGAVVVQAVICRCTEPLVRGVPDKQACMRYTSSLAVPRPGEAEQL